MADALSFLTPQDRVRFTWQAAQYEGAKSAAELFGRRPRRFRILPVDATAAVAAGGTMPAGAKCLRLLRHGQGEHNVWREAEHRAGRTPFAKRGNYAQVPPELWDPPLTAHGRAEAVAAAAQLEGQGGRDPELLVVSPLRRALQTALLAFEGGVARRAPVLAHELCRECYAGRDPSVYDARRGRAELEREFPEVNSWELVAAEPADCSGLEADPHWWQLTSPVPGVHLEAGETVASHVEKAYQFMCWLMDRAERDIAVATHSLFLMALYHGVLELEDAQGRSTGHGGADVFRTGELRAVFVAEGGAASAP